MHPLPLLFRRLFLILRPIEILGLFFLLLMITLYGWLDLPLLSPGRIVFWGVLVLIVFSIITVLRLLFTRAPLTTLLSPTATALFLRDWIPLVIFILVYDNLHDITSFINPYNFDALFIAIDRLLFFGIHPTVLFEQFISPLLTDWLGVNYSLYFLYFPLTLGVLHFTHRYREFHITSFSVMLAIYSGFLFYALFPCVGPILAQHELHTIDVTHDAGFAFYQGVVDLYGSYRNYFHCFPSLHFAVTAVFWYFSFRYVRWLFVLYTPFILSLWISTLYLRWHYVIDLVAGAVIAGYAIFLGPWIYRGWERWRKRHLKEKVL